MSVWRIAGAAVVAVGMVAAAPASAQFFFQSHDFGDGVVHGDEPGMVVPMPGANASKIGSSVAKASSLPPIIMQKPRSSPQTPPDVPTST